MPQSNKIIHVLWVYLCNTYNQPKLSHIVEGCFQMSKSIKRSLWIIITEVRIAGICFGEGRREEVWILGGLWWEGLLGAGTPYFLTWRVYICVCFAIVTLYMYVICSLLDIWSNLQFKKIIKSIWINKELLQIRIITSEIHLLDFVKRLKPIEDARLAQVHLAGLQKTRLVTLQKNEVQQLLTRILHHPPSLWRGLFLDGGIWEHSYYAWELVPFFCEKGKGQVSGLIWRRPSINSDEYKHSFKGLTYLFINLKLLNTIHVNIIILSQTNKQTKNC